MYKYWGYGLTITSEIEFPEFLPYDFDTSDVSIRIGKTPEALIGDDVIKKVNVYMAPTEYLLKFLNIANYYAANGNTIIVEPLPGGDDKSVRLFLLSNAMAAILHQRDMVPVHASAIEHGDNGVILFCGQSGAGKSTTLKMLMQKGHEVFSDDVCVLRSSALNGGEIEIVSSYPMIKLWEDSFAKLQIETAPESDRILPKLPKYAHFFHNDFIVAPKSVKAIFILERSSQIASPEIKKLGGLFAFNEVQKHAYRNFQMKSMKKQDIHFNLISGLVADIGVYKIARPEHGNSIEQVVSLIEGNLPENG